MEVLFLGTGNAFASGARNAMAILVRASGLGVLFDCGPTTLVALKKQSLAPADVDVVLVSHHHGDHFAGVPFLLCHERYQSKRQRGLTVAGPRGTVGALEEANRLLFPGMDSFPFALEVRDLEPDREEVLGAATVRAFPVDHFSRGVALGFRLELDGRVVVFSGDTAWTDVLVRETRGADLFICECSSFEVPFERHMTNRDLSHHRHRIGARRTLLVHPDEDVIARRHELAFELAEDGMKVSL
jgi:ribonuclease BN (tRNA processing enzyme)